MPFYRYINEVYQLHSYTVNGLTIEALNLWIIIKKLQYTVLSDRPCNARPALGCSH